MEQQRKNLRVIVVSLIIIGAIAGGILTVIMLSSKGENQNEPTYTPTSTEVSEETSEESSSSSSTITKSKLDETTDTDNAEPDTSTADTTDQTDDQNADNLENTEPEELIVPDEKDNVLALLPEDKNLVWYWWEQMDDDEDIETTVAYTQEGTANILLLSYSEEDEQYGIIWDKKIPGTGISTLDVSDRNGDGIFEITARTTQGSSGFLNIYQYTEQGPVVMLLSGGPLDGSNTELSYGTVAIDSIDIGDSDGDGADEILLYSELNPEDTLQVYQDMYEWDGSNYTYVGQTIVDRPEE